MHHRRAETAQACGKLWGEGHACRRLPNRDGCDDPRRDGRGLRYELGVMANYKPKPFLAKNKAWIKPSTTNLPPKNVRIGEMYYEGKGSVLEDRARTFLG